MIFLLIIEFFKSYIKLYSFFIFHQIFRKERFKGHKPFPCVYTQQWNAALSNNQGRKYSVHRGDGVYSYICLLPDEFFFEINPNANWFEKKFVGQNKTIWIFPPPPQFNAVVSPVVISKRMCTRLQCMKIHASNIITDISKTSIFSFYDRYKFIKTFSKMIVE